MPQIGRPATIRNLNRQAVLDTLRASGPLSRADLARRLALSKATISATVNELVATGVLTETQAPANGPGRRPTMLHLNDAAGHVAGIDLGGTQVRVAIADLSGRLLSTRREATRAALGAEAVLDQVAGLVEQAAAAAGTATGSLAAIAMGTPGVVDPGSGRLMAAPNLPGMDAFDLPAELHRRLGRPATIENDVNLAAIGEQAAGALRGVRDAAFIAIGTGLGGAIIAGGQLVRGAGGLAGEIGYLRAQSTTPRTLEEVVSGPGLVRAHARRARRRSDAPAILAAAVAGKPAALESLGELLDQLAAGIIALAALTNPSVVVIGGGLGIGLEPFLDRVRQQVDPALPDPPRIELSSLREDAALHGAVALALREGRPRLVERRLAAPSHAPAA
jgi:predicted NBD/HSP70 family sugar kinase